MVMVAAPANFAAIVTFPFLSTVTLLLSDLYVRFALYRSFAFKEKVCFFVLWVFFTLEAVILFVPGTILKVAVSVPWYRPFIPVTVTVAVPTFTLFFQVTL